MVSRVIDKLINWKNKTG